MLHHVLCALWLHRNTMSCSQSLKISADLSPQPGVIEAHCRFSCAYFIVHSDLACDTFLMLSSVSCFLSSTIATVLLEITSIFPRDLSPNSVGCVIHVTQLEWCAEFCDLGLLTCRSCGIDKKVYLSKIRLLANVYRDARRAWKVLRLRM